MRQAGDGPRARDEVADAEDARAVVLELLAVLREGRQATEVLVAPGLRCFTALHDWCDGADALGALAEVLAPGGLTRTGAGDPKVVIAGENTVVVELGLGADEPVAGDEPAGGEPCTLAFLLEASRVSEVRCYLDPRRLAPGALA